jgi:hypothetical protein
LGRQGFLIHFCLSYKSSSILFSYSRWHDFFLHYNLGACKLGFIKFMAEAGVETKVSLIFFYFYVIGDDIGELIVFRCDTISFFYFCMIRAMSKLVYTLVQIIVL